jgi:hypothetical protein
LHGHERQLQLIAVCWRTALIELQPLHQVPSRMVKRVLVASGQRGQVGAYAVEKLSNGR